MNRVQIGLLAGPVLFIAMLVLPPPDGMTVEGWRVAAVAALMAVWWLTEAIPIPATALLPIIAFPLLGVADAKDVTRSYANHLIYLFMGGFLIAVTIQKWQLHHRIALHTIRLVGTSPRRIVLGFMLATAFLSMWISNTATAMLMLTIALAVLGELCDEAGPERSAEIDRFGTALMLGIAYAASVGGIATLIGTPPNAIFAGVAESTLGESIGFARWMWFALPVSVVMLALTWLYLTRLAFPLGSRCIAESDGVITSQLQALGRMSRPEKQVAAVFGCVAALWILRGLVDWPVFEGVRDSTIAMAGALVLFLIPVDWKRREFLLDWPTAVTIPWDIIILFGGGFALAQGFGDSGLTQWIGGRLIVLQGVPTLLVILGIVALMIFLTELTSNTATATLMLPVMVALAAAVGMHPFGLMVAATLAASFAFMLPVATPPNAIVFSSRRVSIRQMARAGLWLNLAGVLIISAFIWLWLPHAWGIDL